MNDVDLSTEHKILLAAKKVFVEKGFDGARMQEIADEAGINKALLHYYFRSKDKLFEGVFQEAFNKLVPSVLSLLNQELPLFDKIRTFTEQYIDLILENPFIPGFVLHELNRNPERIVGMISASGIRPQLFSQQIQEEVEKGTIEPIEPQHLIVNMLAMSIFPFLASPILNKIIFQEDQQALKKFLNERKRTVPQFIINSLRKND